RDDRFHRWCACAHHTIPLRGLVRSRVRVAPTTSERAPAVRRGCLETRPSTVIGPAPPKASSIAKNRHPKTCQEQIHKKAVLAAPEDDTTGTCCSLGTG